MLTTASNEFKSLVKRVRAINPEAAAYLESDENSHIIRQESESGLLSATFIWSDTPQGETYWGELSEALGEWD